MMAFIPVFFFASEYAQISLRKSASQAGLFLLLLLLGLRGGGADWRSHFGPGRRQAGRRAGLRTGGRGLWLLGLQGHAAQLLQARDLGHRVRCRHGFDVGSSQHRCHQPARVAPLVRRGDRHHPDHPCNFGASLGLAVARHDSGHRAAHTADDIVDGAARAARRRSVAATVLPKLWAAVPSVPSRISSRSTSPTPHNRCFLR